MTTKQRIALRKRKERNQRILWAAQDCIGAACLFGMFFAILFVPFLVQ